MEIDDNFFRILGKFAHVFARAETILSFKLIMDSGAPQKVVRALTGKLRLSDAMSTMKKIAEVNEWATETSKELHTVLDQLNHISELRDRVLHRGAKVEGDRFISTNESFYRSIGNLEVFAFTLKDLEDATRDLRCIELRLFRLGLDMDSAFPPKIRDEMNQSIQNEVGELFGPWRYKPVQRETPNQQPRKKSR